MYESSTKETKWVCIQLARSRRPRAFWGSPLLEYTSQVLQRKFPLVYESDKIRDSLLWRSWCYFEAQVWKKDSNIALLSFSIIFLFGPPPFLWPLFLGLLWPLFFVRSPISTCGEIVVSIILSSLGQCSKVSGLLEQDSIYGRLRRFYAFPAWLA